jgi:LuxR family maltose regulon positive regulatory protein
VLRRFTPELCDEVLGRHDSAELLGELELSNLFIVALDAPGGWYRFHHLFRELLQLELRRAPSVDARDIHRQAAAWFRRQGLAEGALEQAFAAGDLALVAELLAESHVALIRSGRLGLFLSSVEQLPGDVLVSQPLVPGAAAVAAGLLGRPRTETARLLALAERGRVERPAEWTPYFEYGVELVRALWTEADAALAVRHARRAVDAARTDAEVTMVSALAALAHALLFQGDFREARAVALEAVERPEAPQRPHGHILALGVLATLDAEERRTESAEALARQAIGRARELGLLELWPLGTARLGLALALAAKGRVEEAEPEALRGESLRRTAEPTIGHAHALLVLAEVRVVRSRLRRATADLERAQRIISEFPRPGRLVTARAARVEEKLALAHADSADRDPGEELSPAELGVLRYLATDLSQREIGARLYISVNTVKSHTREVFRKLGATSRAEAVARADAAGLLDSRESPG